MREEESEKQAQDRAGEDRSGRKSLLPQIAICHPPPLTKIWLKKSKFQKIFPRDIDLIYSQQ